MPERTTPVHRWPEGVLRTGRAAAFLILATGINGTFAALVHGWEPRWIYVAAVGVIAALDGWLIGIVAAIGAVICYQLMSFGRLDIAPDRDAFLLGAAIVAAIASRAMRVSIARPRLPAPKAPPLLTGVTTVAIDLPNDPDAAAAVRKATDSLRRALDEERARAERERSLRQEDEERSRSTIEEIRADLQRSYDSLEEMQRRHDQLQAAHIALKAEFDAALTAARTAAESVADHERSLEQLRAIVRDAETLRDAADGRTAELERSLKDMRALLGHSQMLQQASESRSAELEVTKGQLHSLIDELTEERDAATARAANADSARDQLLARLAETEEARQSAAHHAADLDDIVAALRGSSAQARQDAEERIAALEAEVGRLQSAQEQQRFRMEAEWNEKLARNALELTDRFNAALLDADAHRDAARAEARSYAARVEELQREIATVQASAGELRASIESSWQQELQSRIADVTDIYNQAVIDSEERTDAARAEAVQLSARLAERERELLRAGTDRAVTQQEEAQSLAARVAELQSDNERLHAQAIRAESLQNQVGSLAASVRELEGINEQLQTSDRSAESEQKANILTARVAELEAEAEMLRRLADQQRTQSEAVWSEKFTRSAMEITQRFQGELSDTKARATEAEAEARRLTSRVIELEHDRTAVDAEWNQKLQTIVAHLASDHESDLGQATIEREEARAEARGLVKKLIQMESNVREMAIANEEVKRHNEALHREAEEQRSEAAAQKERADEHDGDWNARLAANALELTQRFNGAMAAADSRLQQANREAESLASRVRELEEIIAGLRSSDEERRAAIDAEWSGKLQTIVNHLASDHEADIGQALLEKEEARAEVRSFTSRLAALQKTLEAEREAQGKSNTEWMAERAQLLSNIDSLRRRLGLGTSAGTTPLPEPAEGGRPSIVIVHHDSAVRAIAKHALESSGYDVITASDGLEAFRVAMSQRPAVIFAEAQMPKMDGRELVQMLKSRPETAGVKIVLMSASAESGERAGDFRADDFLRDPANVEALKTTLANVLAARA